MRAVSIPVAVAVAAVATALAAGAVGAKSAGRHTSGTAYVAVTHQKGKFEYAAGDVTDKVLGSGAVTYKITVGTGSSGGTLQVGGTVTVFSKTGSLSGTDSATLTVNKDGSVTFSNGKLKLTRGTGGQKGHSFKGTFTGTGKTANGPFVFHEKGIYR